MKTVQMIYVLPNFEDLDQVIESRPDAISFGLEGLSSRTRALVSADQLDEWVSRFHEADIPVYLNAQAMVEENRLEEVRSLFRRALDAGVDGFYVADDAYLSLADEESEIRQSDITSRIIIQPETLICSGEDAHFFEQLGVQAISLSHELSIPEILEAAKTCSNLEVLVHGHTAWMESRRPLIQNYLNQIEKPEAFEENRLYFIRELQRNVPLPLWQDELGTHVFSAIPTEAGEGIRAMAQAGIHRFRLDALFESQKEGLKALEDYRALLKGEPVHREGNFMSEQTDIKKEKNHVR